MEILPVDLTSSHLEILRYRAEVVNQRTEITKLEREVEYFKERLALTLAKIFGRSSEKRAAEVSPAQMLLFSSSEEPAEESPANTEQVSYSRSKRQSLEGKVPSGVRFPDHLPRVDKIIDEGEGVVISQKVSERLAAHPNAFYVKRTIRKTRKVGGVPVTPGLAPEVIETKTVDLSFLVYVIIAKYVWHLPLYRQEQILKSQQIRLSRDSLIRYVIGVASLLKPIYVAVGVELFSGNHLFGDETPVMVGSTKNGIKKFEQAWFWTFLGESGCAFYHSPSRAYKEVEPLIKSFRGHFQSDGYKVYDKMAKAYPEITLVGCWAHSRRKFVDAEKGSNAPEAKQALRYIRALYRVEARIREAKQPPDILKLRQRFSSKILKLFHKWLKAKASDPNLLPKTLFGTAVRYTLKRWEPLCCFVSNPKLTIDSNAVEREIRPVALGKKNWLFCASEEGAEASAILYSLIASCRLANVDPATYLFDVLERISHHPASKVKELIPVNWKNIPKNI